MGKRVVPVRWEEFEATGGFCYYTRAAQFYRWKQDPEHVVALIKEQVQRAAAEHVDPVQQAVTSHEAPPERCGCPWRAA